VRRPRDAMELFDEDAFEHDEQMPYWAELWPSGVGLARALASRALGGRTVVELGCGGLALPSIVAAQSGARVLATDWAADALELAAENAERNDTSFDTARVAWDAADELITRGPFDLVLAADVLYEQRNIPLMLDLLPRLTSEVWLADPGRPRLEEFVEQASDAWNISVITDPVFPQVRVHRMRAMKRA
jgi:predicted nicotinamide N-methyase